MTLGFSVSADRAFPAEGGMTVTSKLNSDMPSDVSLAMRDSCLKAQDVDAGQFVIATIPSGVLARWGAYLAALAGDDARTCDDIEFLCAHGFASGVDADGLTIPGARLVTVRMAAERYEVLFGRHVLFVVKEPVSQPPPGEDVLVVVVPGVDVAPGLEAALEMTGERQAAVAMARCA